jgi:hypothetical protein
MIFPFYFRRLRPLFALPASPALLLLTALLALAAGPAYAGLVKGQVTGTNREPLPFANVAVRGATTSTGTNEQGQYALRLAPGNYELVFQYVGYRPQTAAIRVLGGDSVTVLNAQLSPEAYNLGEVTVRSSDKDPAYAIIQQAQQWRAYHQREVASFRARSYFKALGRLSEVPGKVLGLVKVGPDVKPGIFYLSETLSDISFTQPNVIKEHMLSSRISGDSRNIPFTRASAGRGLSFYNNLIKSGFSERGFVSPIAANAGLFYKYELVGSTPQGGEVVHKIRVIPRRAADPVFSGFIYIVEGSWRIHSVELNVGKEAELDYVDNLRIEQLYAPAPGAPHVWLMQSQKLVVNFSAMGFRGSGYVNVVLSNYNRVVPTYPAPPEVKTLAAATPAGPTVAVVAPTTSKELTQQIKRNKPKLSGLNRAVRQQVRKAERDSLRNDPLSQMKAGEVQLVERGVNERDTAYWNQIRPVPLTEEEAKDYHVKDSTETIRNSRPYQDSLDRKRNEFSAKGFLLGGYTYRNTFAKRVFSVDAPSDIVQYNTVEGVVANAQATFSQRTEDRRYFVITPTLRYGFSNHQLNPSLNLYWQLDPARLRQVGLTAGRTVENFNPITPAGLFGSLVNGFYSAYALYFNRNYPKLYRRDGLEISYATEPLNGLTLRATASYFDRHELENTTDRLAVDVKGRAFTSNQPVAAELPNGTGFGRSRATTVSLNVDYRPGTRYINRPDGKFNLGSKYPTFSAGIRQGLGGVLGSDVQYTLLQGGIRQGITLGLLGRIAYRVVAGGFVNSPADLPFMDYHHFAGNRIVLATDFEQFQLLDYYRYSTRHSYIEGHYNHHFNGFIFNKVPLLRQLKWQEVFSLNYLHTAQAGHYMELGAGIEHILKVGRVDFYTALQSGQRVGTGVRIGFGF